jgi:formylglycine-generating enzyme required for sulfatase activity
MFLTIPPPISVDLSSCIDRRKTIIAFFLAVAFSPLLFAQSTRQWGGETLTPLGGSEFQSAKFGRVMVQGNPATSNQVWVPGLGSFLDAQGWGEWSSPEYGNVQRGDNNPGWIITSRFGWTHFAPNAQAYDGWTWTERFNWMKFERPGNDVFLWVPMMRSWMAVQPDGTFHSFEWGTLRPQGMNRYDSSIFGSLTTGDFGGWVSSDRFGWMWANGDGTWFWSHNRQEWLGATVGGGIWSTRDSRFLLQTRSQYAEMARIPAGWFTMGDANDGNLSGNAPLVDVFVDSFYISRTPVTWALWNDVRDWALQNGYTDIGAGSGSQPNHPVVFVNWFDAVKWLNARSEKKGLAPVYWKTSGTVFRVGSSVPIPDWSASGYRLPTEAEWEKAARGGKAGQRFPWGNTITHANANYHSDASLSYDLSPTRGFHPYLNTHELTSTTPVRLFPANDYGLYDMSGNVFEWCWDWYAMTAYTQGALNPRGPSTGSRRVVRGGSWITDAYFVRTAYRLSYEPSRRDMDHDGGFRAVRNSLP